jgi:hypothetical protein
MYMPYSVILPLYCNVTATTAPELLIHISGQVKKYGLYF